MSSVPPSQHRKLWEERNVFVAFVLAVLVPGLGHLYQGRVVKGLIYLFGILGLFVWGVKLGEGVVVYNMPDRGISRKVTLHYAAQFGAGAVTYPALWQKNRAMQENNHPLQQLDQPLTAPFSGRLKMTDEDEYLGRLEGTVRLKPEPGEYGSDTKGTFTGILDGQPIELKLSGNFYLDRLIGAGFRRALKCGVIAEKEGTPGPRKIIIGSIPRSVINGYAVPPDPEQLQELTGRLGKLHELALVFTWIAGLLNILAIWDCVQGPAYGFGDETWSTPANDDTVDPNAAKLAGSSPVLTKTATTA